MERSSTHRALLVATLGGLLYAVAVIYWAASTGIEFTAASGRLPVASLAYAVGGPFLLSAVPLFVLARYGLVVPGAFSLYFLGSTVYHRWYVARPHDALASYLTVWPILLGLVLLALCLEGAARLILDGWVDRFGPRPLL